MIKNVNFNTTMLKWQIALKIALIPIQAQDYDLNKLQKQNTVIKPLHRTSRWNGSEIEFKLRFIIQI